MMGSREKKGRIHYLTGSNSVIGSSAHVGSERMRARSVCVRVRNTNTNTNSWAAGRITGGGGAIMVFGLGDSWFMCYLLTYLLAFEGGRNECRFCETIVLYLVGLGGMEWGFWCWMDFMRVFFW